MMKTWMFVLVLIFCGTNLFTVNAQSGTTPYIVISVVHGRSCTSLTCPVVRTFQPGDEIGVNEIVIGDTIFGNNQWVSVKEDGQALYIPHASVERGIGSVIDEPADVDTSDWDFREHGIFSLSAPVNWRDISDILLNDLSGFLAEYYDEDILERLKDLYQNGVIDTLLLDVSTGASLQVTHFNLYGASMSPESLVAYMQDSIEDEGGEVISGQVVTLPGGESARIHASIEHSFNITPVDTEFLWYMVITDDTIYQLTFGSLESDFADVVSTFDAIANTFDPFTADV